MTTIAFKAGLARVSVEVAVMGEVEADGRQTCCKFSVGALTYGFEAEWWLVASGFSRTTVKKNQGTLVSQKRKCYVETFFSSQRKIAGLSHKAEYDAAFHGKPVTGRF
jgi:hypothetical protein